MSVIKYDPRVIQTVRDLKTIIRTQSEEVRPESNISGKMTKSSESFKEEKLKKRMSGEFISSNMQLVDVNNKSQNKDDTKAHRNSLIVKNKKPIIVKLDKDIENLNFKTKTEFQKKLMNENNIIKYKSSCMGIIKDDDEIKNLCEICLISSSDSLIENLFTDKIFLYKLESLLSSDSNKNNRERFFREEIKKILYDKKLEIDYDNKMKSMNKELDKYIKKIYNYDFYK